MSFRDSLCVRRNFSCLRNTVPSFPACHQVMHRYEDDSIFEPCRLNPVLVYRPLDLTKQLQCCESWENVHSSSTDSPLIQSNSRYSPSKLLLIVDIHEFCQDMVPNQRKRVPLLSTDSLTALTCSKVVLIYGTEYQSVADIPNISSLRFRINFCEMSNNCLTFSKSVCLVVQHSLDNLVQDAPQLS